MKITTETIEAAIEKISKITVYLVFGFAHFNILSKNANTMNNNERKKNTVPRNIKVTGPLLFSNPILAEISEKLLKT